MNNIKILSGLPYLKDLEKNNFFLLAGPCIVENEELVFDVAGRILEITRKLNIPFIFKASYRKANRTRIDSFSGIGDVKALEILHRVRETLKVPVITDIHSAEEAEPASRYVDVLQIPAFLCRQTDIIVAAAVTGKVINIKKGQFMSAEAMRFSVNKVIDSGNNKVILTERGSMFGYRDLVVDLRGIPVMQKFGIPVVLDVTHSLQQPNQTAGVSGGMPEMIETIAKAGIAAGVDGIFLETHPQPALALSDAANMLDIHNLEGLLTKLVKIRETINKF
jgi:2-dehydro-3-deoxyphosphooctonate aldolase (KDO 8-P synthase)